MSHGSNKDRNNNDEKGGVAAEHVTKFEKSEENSMKQTFKIISEITLRQEHLEALDFTETFWSDNESEARNRVYAKLRSQYPEAHIEIVDSEEIDAA
jgi:hypothetical protein